jgi:hypothetical protein
MADLSIADRLALLAYQMLFRRRFHNTDTDEFRRLADAVQRIWDAADPPLRRRLQRVARDVTDPVEDNGGALQDVLLWLLARDELLKLVDGRALAPEEVPERVEQAAARRALGLASQADVKSIQKWLDDRSGTASTPPSEEGTDMPSTEVSIADRYVIDGRNLPETFDKAKFRQEIRQRFEDRDLDISKEPTAAHAAYVAGSLLRASYFDPESPGFDEEFTETFDRGYDQAETVDPRPRMLHRDVYSNVGAEVRNLKKEGDKPTVQEVAAVSDDVLERGPVDDNFTAKVRNAHDDFVSRTPVYDSLELPDVVTDETAEAEVEPANIRAVAMVYASNKLDLAQLMTAVDSAAQDWSDGVLPVQETAGRLFDEYVWNARDRLDPAARQIQYDRIGEFDGYILRFCSATSEFDRSRYLSEYLLNQPGTRRTPQPRDAAVRKTARDLLAYASLHGWAYAQFAAKRMGNHIRQCVEIIEHAEVQKAYSAQGPWQVVERVSAMTTGRAPDIAKQRCLASTGKEIVDMLASKAADIAASLSRYPLFPPPDDYVVSTEKISGAKVSTTRASRSAAGSPGDAVTTPLTMPQRSVFSTDEYARLLNLVESWLAANSVNDSTRFDAAQPREVATSPSIPSFNGSSNGFGGFDSDAVKNQLMQMVSAGQMPTADQVNQLFGAGR